MTPFEVVPRPQGAPARDRLGEGPFWSGAEQALYWVDIAGRRAHRIDPVTGGGESWLMPSSCSAIVPARSGGAVVALVDGLHRLDLETGRTRPFVCPDPDAGNRSNETRCDPQGRLWLGTMHNNLAHDGSPVPLARHSGGFFCV